MTHPALSAQVLAYLGSHHVITLATHGPEGPWASAVFYVNDGLTVYFLSAPTTRHCRNMAGEPRVAATVQEDYAEWSAIKGIQLEGTVTRLEASESLHAFALYARKFPIVGPRQAVGAIAAAMSKVAWYRLTPSVVYFIDNSRGLGHRERLDAADAAEPAPAD